MSLATTTILPTKPDRAFPSLSALRSAHSDLLKRQAKNGDTQDFWIAVEDFLQRGQETGAFLDSPEDRWSAQSALDYWASALFRVDGREVDPILAELDPTLAPELDDSLCPYVGLEAFRESQHELFFGRSRLIGDMISCLKENRLLAALGPSGSGKSSLLGGLLPALKSGALPDSKSWHYLPPMVPGSEPLKNLAHILPCSNIDPAMWRSQEAERLKRDPKELARRVAEQSDQPTILVIDQFEELFTLCEDNDARQAFIANLLYLLRTPEPQHRVILTMRSDYEPFVTRFQEFQSYFDRGQLRVTPLSAAELRDAIEKPAERKGLKFEEGVVQALLEDILGEPAGLPLLQFTLLKLWESKERNCVTWAAYRRLGGGRLALARSADTLYESLIPQNQPLLRRILLRLVRPGSGPEVVNNRIKKDSLYQLGYDPERIDQVLGKIIDGRLVRLTPGETPADTQIEVAHEALVRNWPRLVDWLEEARAEMTARRRWEARAAEWVRLGRGLGGLLDEVQLLEAEHWLKSEEAKELGYDEQLDAFVKASREAVNRAAKERRRKVLLRWGALVGVVLYLIGWGIFAFVAKETKSLDEARAQLEDANATLTKTKSDSDIELKKVAAEKNKLKDDIAKMKMNLVELQGQADYAKEQSLQTRQAMRLAEMNAERAEQAVQDAQAKQLEASIKANKNGEDATLASAEAKAAIQERDDAVKTLKRIQEEEALIKRRQEERERDIADGGVRSQGTITSSFRDVVKVVKQRWQLRPFRKDYRPVQPGTSVSTLTETRLAGTLCCLVRDSAGQEYLLSRSSVFSGPAGTPIVQPSTTEFGVFWGKRNIVAEVVRSGSDPNRSGAIARLTPGIQAEPQIPTLGRIEGSVDKVKVGTKVRLVGRGSGSQEGEVIRIDEDGTIVTDIVPAPGDTGAPILTMDRKIVGMLWGWSVRGRESYVSPIQQVLRELNVELVVK
jgi:hypothetical protein